MAKHSKSEGHGMSAERVVSPADLDSETELDSAAERAYWQEHFHELPYTRDELAEYDQFAPAFEFGWESFGRRVGSQTSFDAAHDDLEREWRSRHGSDGLPWQMARHAVRDAWNRVRDRLAEGDTPKPSAK